MLRGFFCVVALLWAGVCCGATTIGGPTVGIWWNPNESGRGYQIDIQNETMLVTTFIYQSNGAPIWYLSSGTFDVNSGTFHSTYDSYSNGQCFGCAPGHPVVHSGDGGPITITFHSNVTATLTYPGGSTEIVKYLYGFSSPLNVLFGEWSYSFLVAGLLGGDWIIFNDIATDTSGNSYAVGFDDGGLGYGAVATYNQGFFYVIVTQGQFQHAYKMLADDHRANGFAWVVPTGDAITGSGIGAFAARMLFPDQSPPPVAAMDAAKLARVAFDDAAMAMTSVGAIDRGDREVLSRLQEVASGALTLTPRP